MSSHQPLIYCINPACPNPANPVGNRLCVSCQTPLEYHYLWATGPQADQIQPGEKVAERYQVISRQIWLDTLPGLPPEVPEELPEEIIPYLRLHPLRLHVPEAYGFVSQGEEDEILLLFNAPIDINGRLYPAIADAWEQASSVRQVYWLWQILQLWTPLTELGVASSLLVPENIRVEGWRVRLLELLESPTAEEPNLAKLQACWQPWILNAQMPIVPQLKDILAQMAEEKVEIQTIASQLNHLLLSTAAELPLRLEIKGFTDAGPQLKQNEDNCYPNSTDSSDDPLLPRLSIVCDGIGGHEGGEVASQMAVQSIKLQMRALLMEVAEQKEIVSPELLQQQIEASLRVVNNVICACNDQQGRAATQRMGTTLVMALQMPQKVKTTADWQSDNAHELYLVSVGDSRAYWITRNYCQLLTVDDDVASREVRFARSLYRVAQQRVDALSLTQALGTKEAEYLRPKIQRFILEEDGILLLCSDGLSDNSWVEYGWQDYAVPVLNNEISLEDAVHYWINLANMKNGHDNTSVVLTHCRVSPEHPVLFTPRRALVDTSVPEPEPELDLRLEPDPPAETTEPVATGKLQRKRHPGLILVGLLLLLVGGTSVGLFAWWQYDRQGFNQKCQQLPQPVQRLCPTAK
ncbi:MAG: protein phosphatase 2C domain-containing protein [Nostocaceae cyanobacterium]|nr:protein phosphatase 2C domain-containing protein [Nostocaceae cyanobacterium]